MSAQQGWRYIAMRQTGDGLGELLDPDLPLKGVSIEEVLSGVNALQGVIDPEFSRLIAADGRPLLDEWGTAIFAEQNGLIRGGGILTHSGFEGPSWSLECSGYVGYSDEMPYTDAKYFVEADPLDIYRHMWEHIQSQPEGNLGLVVDPLLSGLKIGTKLKQVEFDTQSGPLEFESGPYKLAWYMTHNLLDAMGDLAELTPFDWRERHYWDGDDIKHRLELGYPSLGARRHGLRFVFGENIFILPDVDRDGMDYATDALVLGSGEGAKMKRGLSGHRNTGKLRRVAVVSDSSLRTQKAVNKRAEAEVAWRNNLDDVQRIVVRDTPHAPISSVEPGDEIRIQGDTGWVEVDMWCRVLSRTISPDDGGAMELDVRRSDRLAS